MAIIKRKTEKTNLPATVTKKSDEKKKSDQVRKWKIVENRKGKWAKVLENRDKRVIWENKLYKLDKKLFEEYLKLQKKDMTLEKWEQIYKL